MNFSEIAIAPARIGGLLDPPRYSDKSCSWFGKMAFHNDSTGGFAVIPIKNIGDTEDEAKNFLVQFEERLYQEGIHDGNNVAVLWENGNIRAVGIIGQDSWFDVTDNFTKKTFKELNIVITSLRMR